MKRLFILALLVFAGWYGWTHYKQIFEKRPSHEAVIENTGDTPIERMRIKVDGQTLVKETIAPHDKEALPFLVNRESSFELDWHQGTEDKRWSGGMVTIGPMVQRHIFSVNDDGEVLYRAEPK